MTPYAQQLRALHNATVNHQPEEVLPLVNPARADEISACERIAIYTNGYTQRLADAVRADYPALVHWMGANIEKALADFVRSTPSTHWDLNRYPIGFAAFVEQSGAAAQTCALAALESAITEIFWAPDSEAVDAQALASLPEDAFAQLRFRLRTAAKLLRLTHNANAYLTAFRQGQAPASMEQQTEYLLVLRVENEVQRLMLEPEEFALLEHLTSGITFDDALARMPEPEMLAAKLPEYMARWLQWGVLSQRP